MAVVGVCGVQGRVDGGDGRYWEGGEGAGERGFGEFVLSGVCEYGHDKGEWEEDGGPGGEDAGVVGVGGFGWQGGGVLGA